MSITETTHAVIARLFPAVEGSAVEALLLEQCGATLPLTNLWGAPQFERLWLAVLKISGGDPVKLREAIAVARRDWRDVLVAAGFGHSLSAHREWAARQLPPSPPGSNQGQTEV